MAFLRHYANGSAIGAIELNGSVSIGRGKQNSIVLDDGTVSGEHAIVTTNGGHWIIVDTDSTNGVFYKGNRVKEHVFAQGDIVTIGTHEFEFVNQLPQEFEKTLKIKKSWIPGVYYTE